MCASLVVRLLVVLQGVSAREPGGEVSKLYCRGECASLVVRLVSCIAGGECARA